jgi:hypothetical protein
MRALLRGAFLTARNRFVSNFVDRGVCLRQASAPLTAALQVGNHRSRIAAEQSCHRGVE